MGTRSAITAIFMRIRRSYPGAEQREAFERALAVHVAMTGRKPRGYRAPVYNANQATIDLLIEHGFTYDSSLMADDIPYRMRTAAGQLYEMPPHWGSDDWPPFAHYAEIGYMMPVKSPSEGLAASFEEFEAPYEAGGFWMGIWHPFLTGRLARWRVVERWLEQVVAERKVLVCLAGGDRRPHRRPGCGRHLSRSASRRCPTSRGPCRNGGRRGAECRSFSRNQSLKAVTALRLPAARACTSR